jgi:hypothetical protein
MSVDEQQTHKDPKGEFHVGGVAKISSDGGYSKVVNTLPRSPFLGQDTHASASFWE